MGIEETRRELKLDNLSMKYKFNVVEKRYSRETKIMDFKI